MYLEVTKQEANCKSQISTLKYSKQCSNDVFRNGNNSSNTANLFQDFKAPKIVWLIFQYANQKKNRYD